MVDAHRKSIRALAATCSPPFLSVRSDLQMTDSKPDRDALPVTELRPERPVEFLPRDKRPQPRDRRPTYFVEVE